MKNKKTVVAAVGSLAVVLVGASAWMLNPQEVPEEAPISAKPPTAKLSADVPDPKLDVRAVALTAKGTRLRLAGNFPQSVEAFQQSLRVQEDPFVRFQLGKTLAQAGRKDEARQAFQQVVDTSAKWGSTAKRAMDGLKHG